MARNQEKAFAMLNRFWKAKSDEARGPTSKRPHLASECNDLPEAERWRGQIVREIGRKVAEVQNGAIGEYKIRDVNDEINKLLREKSHWERQIVKLGGPDYHKSTPRITDADGRVVSGGGGYLYFGAARDLPGVRELLEKKDVESKKRTRSEIGEHIGIDYYGFRDEDDGLLLDLERQAESKLAKTLKTAGAEVLRAHVPLPNEDEIRATLLARRKQALLDQLK